MSKFLVGWDEQSIVPSKKVYLRGQYYERITDVVETDITATAMAIESEGEVAVIVSVDIVGIEDFLLEKVRKLVKAELPDFPIQKIIIGATHSHTSINYGYPENKFGMNVLEEYIPADKGYTETAVKDDSVMEFDEAADFVAGQIVKAIVNAWNKREEAMYANEFGRAVVGMCRRVEYDDGTAQMWGDTNTANFVSMEGGNDSGIELLYLYNKDKKLTGIVANIACPAQVLEHRNFISADFWGYAKENLRAKLGDDIYLLAMGGAGGDQCPRDLLRWVQPETPIDDPNIKRPNPLPRKQDPSMFDIKGCKLIGKRISNEILSVYEEITDIKSDIIFKHTDYIQDLPLRRATETEYKHALRELEYYFEKNKDKEVFNFEDTAVMDVYCGIVGRYRMQQFNEVVPTEVHILRFGDVAIATNPFELFLDYGNQIKARSYAAQTFIMQLTNGEYNYLPTEKAEKHGHYSAFIASGCVGHNGGEDLVRKSITEINKLFK